MSRQTAMKTLLMIGLISICSVGCASRGGILGVDRCADVPAGAIPEPVGTKLCQWQTAQINAAAVDRYVLYKADFVGKSSELSPGAIERLSRLIAAGNLEANTMVIEPTGDDRLDQSRVSAVIEVLSSAGANVPDVRIAIPAALGLSGPQAERAAGNAGQTRGSSGSSTVRGGIGSILSGSLFP